ncbi:MAG: amino acid permease [Gammaproteobacteria bacterium]|nr:amino acid permease [Gammaproteobacteria bacterium]NIM74025.1 amino acid permease [Gammaproteobacteria bacterium]NIN38907.1 amino acid permease [Gammaproteobacteria bacterium]NIO25800.1 amino acid permease [Gammaproteobacteria bacterium]NIO66431.1 amino acid permease [Gammaproteobacteria bacterium]
MASRKPPTAAGGAQLDRSLGLGLITLYGLGNILGAGIYVLIGEVIGVAGMGTPLAFVMAAVIAALTAFSYGELAARFPVSAGEAVYVQEAFKQRALSTVVGLLIACSGMIAAATMTRGFTGYFRVLFDLPDAVLIVSLVATLGLIAAWGIKGSARVAAILTVLEFAGLVMIIVVAGDNLDTVPENLPGMIPFVGDVAITSVVLGAFLAFFAFIGFEDMINVAEEVVHPERNLPLGILIALCLSTVLYLLVVLASLTSVPLELLAESDAPLALVYEQATGRSPVVISAIGLLAVVNGALVQIIMAARIFYGMSAKGWLPRALGEVNPRTHTPVTATILVAAIIVSLALWFPLVRLAGATSFLVLAVFTLVNLALVVLKWRRPVVVGVIPCPIWVPCVGAATSFGLLLSQLIY